MLEAFGQSKESMLTFIDISSTISESMHSDLFVITARRLFRTLAISSLNPWKLRLADDMQSSDEPEK